MLSHFSTKVISIDINNYGQQVLSKVFNNVSFHVGDSKSYMPYLIDKFNDNKSSPEFILVDGDHSEAGVKADLDSILKLTPNKNLVIICHDSWNPDCRKGMLNADWESSPFVQFVEIDLLPGNIVERDFDTSRKGEMWGGFAIALLSPIERNAELVIAQSRKVAFETLLSISNYPKPSTGQGKYVSGLTKTSQRVKSYLKNFRLGRFVRRFLKK